MTGRRRIKVRRAVVRGWRPAIALGGRVLLIDRYPAGEPVCHPRPVCYHVTGDGVSVRALRIGRTSIALLRPFGGMTARELARVMRGPVYAQQPARRF